MLRVFLQGAALVFCAFASVRVAADEPISFERDIRPIFAANCLRCHGPEKSQGGLRLDSKKLAFGPTDSGSPAIEPGKADASELLNRVTSEDADVRMPPEGDPLSVEQVGLLRRWIAAGADWPAEQEGPVHWAWVAPQRPSLPKVRNEQWPRNAIDRFILARLEAEGLSPSPEADPAVLCRRLYLDLIGLPPTPEEVEEFVSSYAASPSIPLSPPRLIAPSSSDKEIRREGDKGNDDPYAALVDKLLASPQYGERWARHWLDLARYADSNGFQRDGFRTMWAYRDWVVAAFNSDMPFDRFTVEQIAGDLLPDATLESRIATGFNRCTTVNVEAGTDPEENRVLAVVDRVNTTATVFLGATLACAQCHNHKYDPFTQVDYYRLLAYFNNTEVEITPNGSARQFTGPKLELPAAAETAAKKAALEARLIRFESQLTERSKQADAIERQLQNQMTGIAAGAAQSHVLPISNFESAGGATPVMLPDNSVLLTEDNPEKDVYTITVHTKLQGISGFRLEALTDDALPGKGPGRGDVERPNFVLNEFVVRAAPQSDPSRAQAVGLIGGTADFSQAKFDPAQAIDGNTQQGGWAINPQFHKPHHVEYRTRTPLGFDGGTVLTFELHQNFGGSRTIGRVRLTALTGGGDAATQLPAEIAAVLLTPAAKRSDDDRRKLNDYCLSLDPEVQKIRDSVADVRKELEALKPPSTLVMQELQQPRMTSVMKRGNFLDLGPQVQPGTPASLHPLPGDAPPNRLGLAQWLVDPANPLLARVTVNRWWAELLGRGIVGTQEDFGTQCEPPTHRELLDWLAVEFREHGWSMKHVHRQIVLSAAYRQTSRVSPELLKRDPYNLLYARGPRFRLPAETIRDNALAISGLLNLKQGGPPVYPPQPEGIWRVTGEVDNRYYTSSGEDRYRRGLYTIWRRSAPYPSFVSFDAPDRSSCVVQRPRTNTPLQALTLMNDPVYVEAAGALARRMVNEAGSEDELARVRYGFRLTVAREPSAVETEELLDVYREAAARYESDATKAKKVLAAAKVEPTSPEALQLAAWFHVAEILLNLDETITKN